MSKKSKPIRKIDEASKEFIIELLGKEETHGIDIDSIYYIKGKGWIIFEFLKCDTVDPYDSHPNRYPFNWKKFATLFELSKKLEGELILVNYSKENKWKDNIKLLFVKNVDIRKVLDDLASGSKYSEYIEADERRMSLSEFREWFIDLNRRAGDPWE
jgi:hypothetical protein